MTADNRYTEDQFCEALGLLNVKVPFDLAPGVTVDVRGVQEGEFVAGLIRRFPNLKAQFVQRPEEEAKAKKKAAQGIKAAANTDDQIVAYLREQLEFAPELKAAFCAIACDYPGSAKVEKALMAAPKDKRDGLLKLAGHLTWGDDFEGFLARCGEEMVGLEAMALMTGGVTNPSATPPATSSPA